jgi:hypothetical protein
VGNDCGGDLMPAARSALDAGMRWPIDVVVRGRPYRCRQCGLEGLAVLFVHEDGVTVPEEVLFADAGVGLAYVRDLLAAHAHPHAGSIKARRTHPDAAERMSSGCRRCDAPFLASQLAADASQVLIDNTVDDLPVLTRETRPATEWALIRLANESTPPDLPLP